HRAIKTGGQDEPSVGTEVGTGDSPAVIQVRLNPRGGLYVPEARFVVETPGDERAPIRAEGGMIDPIRMWETGDELTVARIPDAGRVVAAGAHNESSIVAELGGENRCRVLGKL